MQNDGRLVDIREKKQLLKVCLDLHFKLKKQNKTNYN